MGWTDPVSSLAPAASPTGIRGLKQQIALVALGILALVPLFWRIAQRGGEEYMGALSDLGTGLLLLFLLLYSPHWLRMGLASSWAAFQTGASELLAAMQRLPSWEDLHYLTDPAFVRNSTGSFNFSSPELVWPLLLSATLACLLPLARPKVEYLFPAGLTAGAALLSVQSYLSISHDDLSVASRHNALHWFILDAIISPPRWSPEALANFTLPQGLDRLDLGGQAILSKGAAKNVLIIVLEGMPGLYHPEIRKAMGVDYPDVSMNRLAAATRDAMLIPDFTAHSHQTIRGLYSLLCGDFDKLSWATPKAIELQGHPERARDCLPAQMTRNGWGTHFLQGADLSFMGKDRFMPLIGFQQVRGNEWFKEVNPYPFEWGVIDSVFFRGARNYIASLRKGKKPWMLSLLTVGTHQPYAVPDSIAGQFPDRRAAAVDLLDQSVAKFIEELRKDGVLKDTLVIITSDESHGSDWADWVSSWGIGIVLAPEDRQLPRLKRGGFGLVDIEASILDYLGLPVPSSLIGRSFFRDYDSPREMVSYTTSKRRWHTAENLRYECADDGRCRMGKADSLIGPPPAKFTRDKDGSGAKVFLVTEKLDQKLNAQRGLKLLKFANGEIRKLPEKITNEWVDNLVGAQYLDFPARSRVSVSIRVKVIKAPAEGVQLKLAFKQWEGAIEGIPHGGFPILHVQEEGRLEFTFDNPRPRQSFSFHLLGEGKDAAVQLEEFDVRVDNREG